MGSTMQQARALGQPVIFMGHWLRSCLVPLKAFAGITGDLSVEVFCITCQRTVKSKGREQHAPP